MSSNKIGFISIYFFGITAVIGSGIFLLPSTGYSLLGPASIISLLFAGAFAILITMCFASCASFYDRTGGAYLYAKDALGDFVGFEVGFLVWAVRIIAEATLYVGLATAIGAIFPTLASHTSQLIIITITGIFMMTLNLFGVRLTAAFNNVITIAKLVPILLVIVAGLAILHPQNFAMTASSTQHGSFATATLTFVYVFAGYEGVVVAAGEMKDAKHNVPKALLCSMLTVAAIYTLVMVACIGVLGTKTGTATAPLQSTLKAVMGPIGASIVAVGTVISMCGTAVMSTFVTPQSGVALAENKMIPAIFGKTNRYGAPYISIIVSIILGLLLAYSGSYAQLAQISAISRFAQYLPTIIAVMVFSRTRKNVAHMKLPGGWLIPILALIVSVWLLINTSLVNLLWGLGAIVIGIPLYIWLVILPKRRANNSN